MARWQRHFLFSSLASKEPACRDSIVAFDGERYHLDTRTHARTHSYIFFFMIPYLFLAFYFLIVLCSLTYWFLPNSFLSSSTSVVTLSLIFIPFLFCFILVLIHFPLFFVSFCLLLYLSFFFSLFLPLIGISMPPISFIFLPFLSRSV